MLNMMFISVNSLIAICYFTITFLIYRDLSFKQQHFLKKTPLLATTAIFFSSALGHSSHVLATALSWEQYNSLTALGFQVGFDLLTAIVAFVAIALRHHYSLLIDCPQLLAQTQNQLTLAKAELAKINANLESLVAERAAQVWQTNQKLEIEIKDRQRTEQALRESEEQFRQLAENINDVFFLSADNGERILYISPAYEKIFGRSCQSVYQQPKSWIESIYPEDLGRVVAAFKKQNQLKRNFDEEFRIVLPDGSHRWVWTRCYPICNQTGQLQRVAGITEDITERKQASEELRRQNERSRLFAQIALKIRQSLQLEEILETTVTEVQEFLETDRVIIYRLEPDGSGTVITEAVTPGWSSILTQNITDPCFNPNYLNLYRQGRIRAIADIEQSDVQPCHIEFLQQFEVKANLIVPILQGKELWGLLIAQQCASPRQWSSFECELLQQLGDHVGIALAQAQFLEALRESENKYRSVVNNVKEVIFQTDRAGLWTFLNPAWREITGFSVEESIGKSLLDYVHPDDREAILAGGFWFWDSAYALKSATSHIQCYCRQEARFMTKHGEVRWLELHAQAVLADDTIIGTSGSLNDISSRHWAEEEIRAALAKERELSELRSRFVSMTSHEFRTPLSSILSSAELIQHYSHKLTESKKVGYLQRIQSSVHHMTQLLDDVLIVGKAEAGKLDFKPAPLALSQLCCDLVEEMQLIDGNQHIIKFSQTGDNQEKGEVETKESGKFPFLTTSHSLSTLPCLDEKLLRQILSNLLSNALKYSPLGSTVNFKLAIADGNAIFQIEDTGIGIPPEDRQHLFDSFHRAKNVGDISGTGLGLAIVKKCVDLHRGYIDVKSQVGVGTTFTVTLPLNN